MIDIGRSKTATIDCVAILAADGLCLSRARPARHNHVILDAHSQGVSLAGAVQGFLTSQMEFVTREEAYKIARENGQLVRDTGLGALYSEDLW